MGGAKPGARQPIGGREEGGEAGGVGAGERDACAGAEHAPSLHPPWQFRERASGKTKRSPEKKEAHE